MAKGGLLDGPDPGGHPAPAEILEAAEPWQALSEARTPCDYEDPVVPDADTCAPTPSVAALPWSVEKSSDGQPNDNVGLTLLGLLALRGETGILSIHPSGVARKLQARLFYDGQNFIGQTLTEDPQRPTLLHI